MTITTKGQITIPKHLRDKCGLNEQTDIEFIEDGTAILIVKKEVSSSGINSVYGIFGKRRANTDILIKKLRGK